MNKGYNVVGMKPSIIWNYPDLVNDRIDADYFRIDYIANSAIAESNKFFQPLSEYAYQPNESLNSYYPFERINYIDIGNVSLFDGSFSYENYLTTEAPSRAKRIIKPRDILVSTVRPNRNAIVIVDKHAPENLICSTGFCVLRANNIKSGYLFAFFKTDYAIKELVRRTTGGMYPAISNEDILEVKLPIPTEDVQQYIGNKIRKAEELREEAKRLRKDVDTLFKKHVKFVNLSQVMRDRFTRIANH